VLGLGLAFGFALGLALGLSLGCDSPLLKKTTTRLGQFRKSTD